MPDLTIPERAREKVLAALDDSPWEFSDPRQAASFAAGLAVTTAAPIVVAARLRQITEEHGHWINRDYLRRLADEMDPEPTVADHAKDAIDAALSRQERLRLGRELCDALSRRMFDHLAVQGHVDDFAAVSLEDGQELGLPDDVIAYRHLPTGLTWVVDVEVSCVPVVDRG